MLKPPKMFGMQSEKKIKKAALISSPFGRGGRGPLLKRKEFLQLGSFATASFMVPKFLKSFEAIDRVPPGNKVTVILQLSGGNDGLNTVIPVRNDIYYRERPVLGIQREKAIQLTEEAGLHPEL